MFRTGSWKAALRLCITGSLLAMQGCLFGCTITPTPAHQLFGTSNPSMNIKVRGYGVVTIPTDFKGKFKIDKSPDGTLTVDVQIDSRVTDVVTAEGERIKNQIEIRQGEFAMILEAKKLELEFWKAMIPEATALIRSLLPVPASPVP